MNNCDELTPKQLKTTNGCGSSYWAVWIFRIPKWVSKAFFRCCNRHDIMYQYGMTKTDKEMADDEIYNCMYYSAYHGPWYQRWIKTKTADFVYWCLNTKLSQKCFKKA